ncbi:DNA double-strand break repair nuclease NurA [Candidatus Woesearchaeota archaeon]|nr:DNA double-strand break repair nuclease NurA [Candidatus Woesearchaeota archaeon]
MDEVISEVISSLNKKVGNKNNLKLPKDDFIKINKIDSDKKIAFVDGGNSELLKANNFSLQMIRVFGVIFQNNKKIKSLKNEFFLLAHSKSEGDKINYGVEIFQIKGDRLVNENDLVFDSFDETIKEGINRAEISKIGEVGRRFAELSFAKIVCDELNKGDILILDGNLRISYKNENNYLNKLKEKDVFVCGLAKSSQIFSKNGDCLIGDLGVIGNDINYPWYFKVKDNLFAVKLNKNSKYIFEFEIVNAFKINEVLGCLISNCNDAVFPGYPYGLIVADEFARISNKEKEYLINLFKVKAGKNWKEIEKYLNSVNSHAILDKISF